MARRPTHRSRQRYFNNSQVAHSRGKTSPCFFAKYFTGTGKEWEIKKTDDFEVINKYFEAHWPALLIPRWAVERVRSTFNSESQGSETATTGYNFAYLESICVLTYSGLESHFSSDTQQSMKYTANTSLSTTLSADIHSTGVGESQRGQIKCTRRTPN